MRPDVDNLGFFDNAPNHAIGFWGVYRRPLIKKSLCWIHTTLALTEKQPHSTEALPTELRHSFGRSLSRPVADKPGWDFDYEGFGNSAAFGSANIRAWTLASETGYRIPTFR